MPVPKLAVTEALKVISDWITAALVPLLPMNTKTFPVVESTVGESEMTWAASGLMLVEPRQGGEPDAQVPALLNVSLT